MQDSERTYKRKVISRGAVFKSFPNVSSYLHLKSFRFFNIFKSTNVTKLSKAILEISYTVLQVTSKWKTLKHSPSFFKGH